MATSDYLSLEVGLRRVAEELPAKRAAWLIRFDRFCREADGVFGLYAKVTDLYASHCCVLVAALLEKDQVASLTGQRRVALLAVTAGILWPLSGASAQG